MLNCSFIIATVINKPFKPQDKIPITVASYVVHPVLQDAQHMLASYSYGNIGPVLKFHDYCVVQH